MLEMCRRSLDMQTCQDYEQIIIRDDVGIGVNKANILLRDRSGEGDYIWIFDDDEYITNEYFVSILKAYAIKNEPEVMVIESLRGNEGVVGSNPEMKLGNIGFINVVCRKDIWERYKSNIGDCYAGDWPFIKSMIEGCVVFHKIEGLMLKAQRVSRGIAE